LQIKRVSLIEELKKKNAERISQFAHKFVKERKVVQMPRAVA